MTLIKLTVKDRATKIFENWGHQANWFLLCSGFCCSILYFLLARLEIDGAPERVTETLRHFMALLALLFVILLVTACVIRKFAPTQPPRRITIFMILGFAGLFRFLLLPQTPWLSNDIYRYLWDGQLLGQGVNPYALPPAAEELSRFRDATIYPRMDHKNVHSVYPPFLQTLFWLGQQTSQVFSLPPVVGLKFIFILIDLALVGALFHGLAQLKLDPRWAVLYAWHPLPIVEIAGSGHTDGIGALMLVLTLIFLQQRKYFWAVFFLALGFLVKFIPVLFLPFLFLAVWQESHLPKAAGAAALFALIILASYAPFLSAGEKLWSGLLVYSDKWRFNDGFFSLVFSAIHALLPEALVQALMIPAGWEITEVVMTTRRIDLALLIVKVLGGGIFIFIYLRLLWQLFKSKKGAGQNWVNLFSSIFAAFFLLSPTLQPWYLLWLLPLLILQVTNEVHKGINRFVAPFLFILSATVFLSYWVLENYLQAGLWREPAWVKWVEYGIPAIVCLWIMHKIKLRVGSQNLH